MSGPYEHRITRFGAEDLRGGEIKVWEDTPKRGETYGGWYFSRSIDGHVVQIEGGFQSKREARAAGEAS